MASQPNPEEYQHLTRCENLKFNVDQDRLQEFMEEIT